MLLVAGMTVDGVLFILTLYAQRVLGASAVQFGLMTAAMTVMSVVGSFAGQAVVTKKGFRPVAASGMALIAVGSFCWPSLRSTAASSATSFVGLLVFGTGLGAAFVGAQIAALSGVPDGESGLAAGIADTFFTIGGALGLAVLSTVAASRTEALLSTRDGRPACRADGGIPDRTDRRGRLRAARPAGRAHPPRVSSAHYACERRATPRAERTRASANSD